MSGESADAPVSVRLGELREALQRHAERQGTTVSDLLRDGARQVINPYRGNYMTVNEELPYRFDRAGNLKPGAHDFSTDLINGLRHGDQAAYQRAMDFFRVQLDATNTTDTGALNPARQRPDMWVGQRPFNAPIWQSIEKGTLTDITPFIAPKFGAASGLVAGHTEGVEPAVGDFVTTSQTVNPGAMSGKAEINREVWDQGGNPQVSHLVWRQMVQGWHEALEAGAAGLLDSLSPTQITLPAGAQNSALVAALKKALVSLQFTRGGYRMRQFPGQVDLYTRLVEAVDADGRPLLPTIGAENADGVAARYFGSVNVGGQMVQPAWALAASSLPGGGVRSSYLFDEDVVCGWASQPQRLEFDYQVKSVFIGIWGYQALACTDVTGVREVLYNPVGS